MIVAIDGPAGSGKSTVGRLLARRLGFRYLDTGAMYRAITWKAMAKGIDLDDESSVAKMAASTTLELYEQEDGLRVVVDGEEVTGQIRSPEVTGQVHRIARLPRVREMLVAKQRQFGHRNHTVAEGRDMTTVVFPDAEVKFYLDAALPERAKRRYLELRQKGVEVGLEEVRQQVRERDRRDLNRQVAPLRRARDAIYVDTTGLTITQVVDILERHVRQRHKSG